jgi:hypothetical protein
VIEFQVGNDQRSAVLRLRDHEHTHSLHYEAVDPAPDPPDLDESCGGEELEDQRR